MRKINLCVDCGLRFLKMASSTTVKRWATFGVESTIYLRRRASESSELAISMDAHQQPMSSLECLLEKGKCNTNERIESTRRGWSSSYI
ncbi:hypothetical protein LINPERHAP2_LOCUS26649 [Linum perenne]